MLGSLLKIQIAKVRTTPARESDLEVKIVKNWQRRNTFESSSRQNLHACVRERFGRQNCSNLAILGRFLKFASVKICTTPARESYFEVKTVETPGPDHFLTFNFGFAWQASGFQASGFRHSVHVKIAQTYCNSEANSLAEISFCNEFSQKSYS